ncbi:NAD-dependent epimerase/dehydratase family protein [Bdellovibrio bacteriovorus]|uniref:NAD-dependent epimerase/dehydratase family protein n=1 Tax=Bdellovibrio bacteriovorus TaxID=959 RepID=UPI0035A66CAB
MIIVTGANGFIGSVMVWELNQKGLTDIVAVDSVGLSERNLLRKQKITKFLLKDDLWPFLETEEAKKESHLDHPYGRLLFHDRNQQRVPVGEQHLLHTKNL